MAKDNKKKEASDLLNVLNELKVVMESISTTGNKTFLGLNNDVSMLVSSTAALENKFSDIGKSLTKLGLLGNAVIDGLSGTDKIKFGTEFGIQLKSIENGIAGFQNVLDDMSTEISSDLSMKLQDALEDAFSGDTSMSALDKVLDNIKGRAESWTKNLPKGEFLLSKITKQLDNIKKIDFEEAKILKEQYDSLQKQKKLQELQVELIKEITAESEEYKETYHKISATISSILKDSKFAATVFAGISLSKVTGEAERLRETFGELRKDGQTIGQAFHSMEKSFNVVNTVIGIDTGKAIDGLEDSIGDMEAVTSDMGADVAFMGKQYGIAEGEAGKLVGDITKLSGFTAESAINATKYAGNLSVAAHVAPGRVMEQIANNSEEFAKYSSSGSKNLFTAAVAAVKMGVEFKTLAGAADHLLDFEESINDQMEASVLLGKELNFDRARELANKGDILGANKEILKQLGSEADFNRMSVIQKKSLAQATGYSIQDLSIMVKNQGKLNELTNEQVDALNNGSKITDVLAMGAENMVNSFDPKNILMVVSGLASMKMLLDGSIIKTKLLTAATVVWKTVVWATSGIFSGMKTGITSLIPAIGKVTGAVGTLKDNLVETFSNTKLAKNFKENVIDKIKGKTTEKIEDKAESAAGKLLDSTGKTKEADTPKDNAINNITKGIGKINWTDVLKGAAAMIVTAGALYVFAKALQEFKDISWKEMGMGLLTLVGAITVLGVAAMLLTPVIPAMMGLGAALLFVGGAVALMGVGFKAISDGISNITKNIDSLVALGPALFSVAAGLSAMAFSGFAAIPIIGALTGLALIAPALRSISGIFGGDHDKTESKHTNENDAEVKADMSLIAKKLDELIGLVKKGHDINIDGKKLGAYLTLAAPRQQVTNMKPV